MLEIISKEKSYCGKWDVVTGYYNNKFFIASNETGRYIIVTNKCLFNKYECRTIIREISVA